MTHAPRIALSFLLVLLLTGCLADEKSAASSSTAASGAGAAIPAGAAGGPVKEGEMMPPYTARTLEGGRFDLAGEKGKVVLVNIWATWCAPCRHEIPELIELQQAYSKEGFGVLGISVDGNETAKAIPAMLEEYGVNYPVVHDPRGTIADLIETNVLPTSALIDREGRLVWSHVGVLEADDEALVTALRAAL